MKTQSRAAEPHRNYRWLLWPVALLVLAVDQATKYLVSQELALWESWHPFDTYPLNLFAITHASNTGAAFGIFPDAGIFFIVVAIVVSVAIALYYRRLPGHQWWLFLSLGLQLGGALGNLTDRLRLGYVVDFVEVGIWPVFNVADSAIVVGVIMLAWHFWREEQSERHAVAVEEAVELDSDRSHPATFAALSAPPPSNGHRRLEPHELTQLIHGDGRSAADGEPVEPPDIQ